MPKPGISRLIRKKPLIFPEVDNNNNVRNHYDYNKQFYINKYYKNKKDEYLKDKYDNNPNHIFKISIPPEEYNKWNEEILRQMNKFNINHNHLILHNISTNRSRLSSKKNSSNKSSFGSYPSNWISVESVRSSKKNRSNKSSFGNVRSSNNSVYFTPNSGSHKSRKNT
jgi:hypothetical protein